MSGTGFTEGSENLSQCQVAAAPWQPQGLKDIPILTQSDLMEITLRLEVCEYSRCGQDRKHTPDWEKKKQVIGSIFKKTEVIDSTENIGHWLRFNWIRYLRWVNFVETIAYIFFKADQMTSLSVQDVSAYPDNGKLVSIRKPWGKSIPTSDQPSPLTCPITTTWAKTLIPTSASKTRSN